MQRAQRYVSGNKLKASEVKKLEAKGFSSREVRAVANSMDSVGARAQKRIDSSSGSGSKSSGGSSRVQAVGGTGRVRVDSQGRAIASSGAPNIGQQQRGGIFLTGQAADKINRKVEKAGGSLTGGDGMAVSRYVTVKDPGRRNTMMNKGAGGGSRLGGGKHQFAIYSPVAQASKEPKTSSRSGSGAGTRSGSSASTRSSSSSSSRSSSSGPPISVGGATGNYATVEKLEQEAPKAPNFYDTANSFPQNPNFSPTGAPGVGSGNSSPIYWDRTAENLFSYSDRLGDYNRRTGQELSNIAAQDRRESSAYLQNFARALPPAPDPNEANESVLSFLEQANKRLGFGKSTMGGVTV